MGKPRFHNLLKLSGEDFLFKAVLLVFALASLGCSKTGKDFSQQNGSNTPNPDGSVATIIFSSTQSGAGQSSFNASSVIYGRIQNSGPGASSCLEKFGSNDGFCQTPTNYTNMPNSEWQYDSGSSEWKATLSAQFFTEGTYKVYWKNAGSNKSVYVSIQILEPGKPQMLAVEYPYNKPETSYNEFEAIYFQTANAPQTGSQSCTEEVGVGDGTCLQGGSWVNMPGNGWKYSTTLQRWEALVKSGDSPIGAYRFFWKNSATGAVSSPMVLTVSADTGPTVVFSATAFGPPTASFKTTDTFYAYVINGDPINSLGCLENLASNAGLCNTDSNFVALPNRDWSFSVANQRWEGKFGPNGTTQLSTETVDLKVFGKNGSTGMKSQPTSLKLVK